MSIKKVCEAIKANKNFLITAHYDPEGDSLGSQLAMAEILRQLGKNYVIVNADKPPVRYHFMKGISKIEKPSDKDYKFDVAIVLDCPVMERIAEVARIVKNKPIINIDHHISNRNFGAVNYVLPSLSSTGEIIYGIMEELGAKLNKDMAENLYVAMLTDTGGFRYSNTTARTLGVASKLLAEGVDPKKTYERIYESHSPAGRRLLGFVLSTLRVSKDGKIAWMYLTKAMFKRTKAAQHDTENFVNYARFIDGVRIAALFNDSLKNGFVKVSFRSNGDWTDVNKIAGKFGGGGHVSASGCLVKGSIKSVEKKIIKEAKKTLM